MMIWNSDSNIVLMMNYPQWLINMKLPDLPVDSPDL